ncbi:4-carboxymuconolactone decarboxylase [Aeromicrobium phragmitis]|uniref:4-carboxymuconolactone decarboxylase n=1 Tax=Aeromicrobium phragmitis TaxID=2478914 RepID=A0A3L8PPY7_9ACTN|nr:4-carboxymuconolactone decarboxylase [Aeromicrobium phragmitis]RLV57431.1 4-carboxymuconolactone decarboxylase [Aeromicrobium phragmitis]
MTVPRITGVELSPAGTGPLVLLGPSLGTSATALWSAAAAPLTADFHVVAWNLPGHGANTTVGEPFTMAELAAGVVALADALAPGEPFSYAGDSVGGAVGLQLLLDVPDRVRSAALLATGAKIGEESAWRERAATVRDSGTPSMVTGSAQRWFGPDFMEREPEVATELLHSLQDADAEGYAQVCEALATFDVRERLGEISAPVLAIAGAEDGPTPPASLEQIANGVQHGRLVVLDGVAHLPPAERPHEVGVLLLEHFTGAGDVVTALTTGATSEQVYDAGMTVRREVLGDAHVDRATASITDFTEEFQRFITQYAWGGIWTRPGLDRRTRSFITLTALLARGHHEEFAMHVRAAKRNGLSDDEIKELILQCAIYCGVPDANHAFKIAQRVLAEPSE